MDIDILFYNREIMATADLIIPHPRIPERRFVLEPLNEIAAGFINPISGKTVQTLLRECTDPLPVKKM
jgi:7,8-dihydro-6-hydroxymethylpterin-pyrophosphokinase